MASVTEHFDVADADLHGVNGWNVSFDSTGGATLGVETLARAAVNANATTSANAFQLGTDKVPTGIDQEVAAYVTSTQQAASGQVVGIGTAGQYHATFASRLRGIRLLLEYKSNGERELRIESDLTGTNAVIGDALTLVAQGGIAQGGFHGGLNKAGAVSVPQWLRLRVTEATGGLLVRGYANSYDDDMPTIERLILVDWIDRSPDEFGYWTFEFGATTARTLAVAEFFGTDYTADRKTVEERNDFPLLRDLIDQVLIEVDGGTNSSRDRAAVKVAIWHALDSIASLAGNRAWWLTVTEDLELTEAVDSTADTFGLVVLPAKCKRLLKLSLNTVDVTWKSEGRYQGRELIRLDQAAGSTFLATYIANYARPDAEDAMVPIPREYGELVVVGAARRLAERDPENRDYVRALMARHKELEALLTRDLAANFNQERKVIRPRSVTGLRPPRTVGEWPS